MNNGRILIANLARGQIGGAGGQSARVAAGIALAVGCHGAQCAPSRSACAVLRPRRRIPIVRHRRFSRRCSPRPASLLRIFCLVNQFSDQLDPAVRSALLGNAGTLIVFRVGSADAELLAPEFYPVRPDALADQAEFWAWLRRDARPSAHQVVAPTLFRPPSGSTSYEGKAAENFGPAPCRDRTIVPLTKSQETSLRQTKGNNATTQPQLKI